jgi:hypothetical protein
MCADDVVCSSLGVNELKGHSLFGKYAVTKKLSSSEEKPAKQSNYDDFIRLFVDIRQAELPWEKRQVGNFVAENALDIFHVQTSEAKSCPNGYLSPTPKVLGLSVINQFGQKSRGNRTAYIVLPRKE